MLKQTEPNILNFDLLIERMKIYDQIPLVFDERMVAQNMKNSGLVIVEWFCRILLHKN